MLLLHSFPSVFNMFSILSLLLVYHTVTVTIPLITFANKNCPPVDRKGVLFFPQPFFSFLFVSTLVGFERDLFQCSSCLLFIAFVIGFSRVVTELVFVPPQPEQKKWCIEHYKRVLGSDKFLGPKQTHVTSRTHVLLSAPITYGPSVGSRDALPAVATHAWMSTVSR